ncbi:MAG TPA: GNAT family N-acetyltransferase [Gemmatimonadaceae bacterium]|jgi:GNAT superfamily N-acetyltransferase|nr:GNAT family N-acetyltransferase [Gemmatimonadaceae bacterium]
MPGRLPLVVRALTLEEIEGLAGANSVTPEDLPRPLTGFRIVGGPLALSMSRGDEGVWQAAFARIEMRALGRAIATGAMIGPLRRKRAFADHDNEPVEDAYRAFFDYVLFGLSIAPNVISARVGPGENDRVDILWRLGAAIDARVTIQRESDDARLDIFRAGRRSAIASALSCGLWESPSRLTISGLVLRPRPHGSSGEVLHVLARDVSASPASVEPSISSLEYQEATAEEVQRHPLRFGLGLCHNDVDPALRRHFVGCVDGQVAFRMALDFSAPVIERVVVPSLGPSLPPPVALVSQCATEPRFRGRSIYPAALQWVAQWAGERGVRTLVLLIDPNNAASLRGAAKAGFERIGAVATGR